MIIVSDTTPLHYLILIDAVDLLPVLLGEIVIPETVFSELNAGKTPKKVKQYLERKPDWLKVRRSTLIFDKQLDEIDPGEREAILLAEELSADGILIDDLAGRAVAIDRGLYVLGTLGFLELAAEDGLVDFLDLLEKIKVAGFYISKKLENQLRLKHKRS